MLASKQAGMKWAMLLCGIAASGLLCCAQAQSNYSLERDGGEYLITSSGYLPGEQTNPALALGSNGGFLVWQDNVSDLQGEGISAQKLGADLQPVGGEFRVNLVGENDQENPAAAVFADGSALFAWQSGVQGNQKIAYRILSADFRLSQEFTINQPGFYQNTPKVAVLNDGNAVIVWNATDATSKPMGVYAQKIGANGKPIGSVYAIAAGLGNRSASVTALSDGGFAVAWTYESITLTGKVDNYTSSATSASVKVLTFDNNLKATSSVKVVSPSDTIVANPTIAADDSGIAVAWSLLNLTKEGQTYDIGGAVLDLAGNVVKSYDRLNTWTLGDQYRPQLAASEGNFLAIWTSLRQDGSYDGVFGQFFNASGFNGSEIQVNTTTYQRQTFPTIASKGAKLLVSWSSYMNGENGFDLFAQRFFTNFGGIVLETPEAPMAYALTETEIFVSWPAQSGRSVKQYELVVDNAPALVLNDNYYTLLDVDYASTHTFKYRYSLTTGEVSPDSPVATVTTWGYDKTRDGMPDDWQEKYFGSDKKKWPKAYDDSDNDGVVNIVEFLNGTDPTDPESALIMRLLRSEQGVRLEWNTVPGFVYQVQTTEDAVTWKNLGAVRRATGKTDSIALDPKRVSFFRIVRLGGADAE